MSRPDVRAAALRPGGGPAGTGADSAAVVLTCEEVAYLRNALVSCSRILTLAGEHPEPEVAARLRQITQAATGRSPNGALYEVNLAIDYLDFAPAARRPR